MKALDTLAKRLEIYRTVHLSLLDRNYYSCSVLRAIHYARFGPIKKSELGKVYPELILIRPMYFNNEVMEYLLLADEIYVGTRAWWQYNDSGRIIAWERLVRACDLAVETYGDNATTEQVKELLSI